MWIATMVKRGALLAAGLALAACQSLVPGPPAGPELAAQTLQVSPRVVLAGALSKDAVTTLRATQAIVIDLRHPQEGATDEARLMARHGIPWINLPQGRDTPSVEDVAYLDDVLAAWPGRNVVLHCATGNRAGKLWASRRIAQGATVEAAIEEVAAIVTMAPVRSAIGAPVESQ